MSRKILPFGGERYFSCVVFLDDPSREGAAPSGKALRFPRRAQVADLIAAAGATLGIDNPRCARPGCTELCMIYLVEARQPRRRSRRSICLRHSGAG